MNEHRNYPRSTSSYIATSPSESECSDSIACDSDSSVDKARLELPPPPISRDPRIVIMNDRLRSRISRIVMKQFHRKRKTLCDSAASYSRWYLGLYAELDRIRFRVENRDFWQNVNIHLRRVDIDSSEAISAIQNFIHPSKLIYKVLGFEFNPAAINT
ncbi:hypothetical protein ACOME3_002623 [Neoechinorhynchus agilis]